MAVNRTLQAVNRGLSTTCQATSGGSISSLITPTKAGTMQLDHRIAMTAMTRLRMEVGTEKPREINALHYEQRASKGGLLVTECIQIDGNARGYVRGPVLETKEQAEAWRLVVDRVHGKGGFIFAQLVHTGRVSHNSLATPSGRVVAPSAVQMAGQLYIEGGVKADYSVPHALEVPDIQQIVKQFAKAAKSAVQVSGFDGIELHGFNGYLIQEFLAKKTNQRTDQYGGSIENRARFALEVVDACIAEVGADKVALKFGPGVTFSDLIEPEADVLETLAYLGPQLARRKLAYVCLTSCNAEPYFRYLGLEKPNVSVDVWRTFREHYPGGVLMINGGLSVEQGEAYVQDGTADLVGYGAVFIATPNMPDLVAAGKRTADLNFAGGDSKLWYSKDPSQDADNYTSFPDLPLA